MNTRWIRKSRISNTSHQRPAPHSGTPERQGPSWCSPWLVPSHTSTSEPEKIQLNSEKWCSIPLSVPPTSPNSWPICSLPEAMPHLGKYTWASSANRSRMLRPSEVWPPRSNALRYSIATLLRCSSVMVWVATAMGSLPLRRGRHAADHVVLHPLPERLAVPADPVPRRVRGVVAHRIAVRVAGRRPARDLGDGGDHPRGQHDRAGPLVELVDDLLHGHDGPLRGQDRLLLHAGDAPQLDGPGAVGPLRVDDGHVGAQRRHRGELLAREGAGDDGDVGRAAHQVGPGIAPQHRERQPRGPRHIAVGHP